MQADWINPFIVATINVFDTMLQCEINRGVPCLKNSHQPNHEVSGLMHLKGHASGVVVVSMSRSLAINATRYLNGSASGEIDEELMDMVGELTNMVAGGANSQLEELHMRIGLPTMISGRYHAINYPPGVAIITVPFDTEWGPLSVDASLTKSAEATSVS